MADWLEARLGAAAETGTHAENQGEVRFRRLAHELLRESAEKLEPS